jgi:S1-C subfamily serine protease
VVLAPGKTITARLAGRDRNSDIALLRPDKEPDKEMDQPTMPFGDATSLSVGDFSIAIARTRRGNIVASFGIISGLMGEWQVGHTRIDQFIRPDLTLYPGFSGGALVDAAGNLVGLNTSGLLRGKPIVIPSSTLTRIAEEIATSGHVARPYIGLVMQPVEIPQSLQQSAGIESSTGLLAMNVEPGGPSDTAGILLGDILMKLDGKAFDSLHDLQNLIAGKKSGDTAQLDLVRGGQRVEKTIKIGSRPLP